jgi:MFS family permease
VTQALAPQTAPDPRRWWALALLCGAFFMVILDAAIVIVALPSIQADLGFSEQGLQWVVSAYALTFGGPLLLGGRAADLLGRRRVFMVGLGFFTLASLLCGLAWSPAALIAARAVQGVGAGIMTPTALSIISTTFPEGAERNKALGIWGVNGGVGATAGWLIGGPLVEDPGWESSSFINIPLGLAAVALSPVLLRESRAAPTRRSYDPALTLYGQRVLGYSAVKFGLGTAVFAAMAAVGSIVGQAVVLKLGFRVVAATGMALMGAGSLLLTQVSVSGSYFGDMFVGLLVFGPGVGLAFVTASIAALAGVAEHESGLASGLSNTAFQIGAALGVAIVTTVAVSGSEDYLTANDGANPLVVLNEGFQSAFVACAVLAAIGMALALLLLGRPRKAPQERVEAVPVPIQNE